jgi:Alcohol dehydrogenase GroES-like domain
VESVCSLPRAHREPSYRVTIYGTNLHILKGDIPAVTSERILGHEGAGTITEVSQAASSSCRGTYHRARASGR